MSGRRLPVAWDGAPVAWGPFATDWQPHICPPPPPDVCTGCGMATETARAIGTRTPPPGVTLHPAAPYPPLHLYRCTRCGHDAVGELTGGAIVVWDLDADDYGPEGSWPPE